VFFLSLRGSVVARRRILSGGGRRLALYVTWRKRWGEKQQMVRTSRGHTSFMERGDHHIRGVFPLLAGEEEKRRGDLSINRRKGRAASKLKNPIQPPGKVREARRIVQGGGDLESR